MTAITLKQYCMGREAALTPEITANAELLLANTNGLLEEMEADGIVPGTDQITGTAVASGLRTLASQDKSGIQNANSPHLIGKGEDLQDTENRDVARWCLKNLAKLKARGLYMEHPQWTSKRNSRTQTRDPWVHFQTKSASSTVFRPSMSDPTAPPLPEQVEAGVAVFEYTPQEGEVVPSDLAEPTV